MGKAPSFPWYPNDFDRDLKGCHASTAGIWARCLNDMWWRDPRGKISAPYDSYLLLCGCTSDEFDLFLHENTVFKFADVTDCNGYVTVINRRMHREDIARKKGKNRVEKHRKKQEETEVKRDCNVNVQDETTFPSSSFPSSSPLSFPNNNSCSTDYTNLCQQWQEEIDMQPPADVFHRLNKLLDWLTKEIAVRGFDQLKSPAEIISEEISTLATKFPGKRNVSYLEGTIHRKLEDLNGVADTGKD